MPISRITTNSHKKKSIVPILSNHAPFVHLSFLLPPPLMSMWGKFFLLCCYNAGKKKENFRLFASQERRRRKEKEERLLQNIKNLELELEFMGLVIFGVKRKKKETKRGIGVLREKKSENRGLWEHRCKCSQKPRF